MKRIKISFLYAILLVVFGINAAWAQSPLAVVSASAKYNSAVKGAEKYNLPASEDPLEAIVKKLEAKAYSELHIFALTEADNIVFHGLSLCPSNLDEHKAKLEKFKAYKMRIVFHSLVLGSSPEGANFLVRLSEMMGNKVVVE